MRPIATKTQCKKNRAARTIIQTLEKLTYQKLGDMKELDVKAEAVESRFSSEDDIPKR